jgi:TPR repeat protein
MKNIFASCLILCASVVWASDFKEGLVDYNKGNFVAAITKFEKAANEGQVDAQYILGMMYSLGIGAAINYAESQK